jgi:hypothetical protein
MEFDHSIFNPAIFRSRLWQKEKIDGAEEEKGKKRLRRASGGWSLSPAQSFSSRETKKCCGFVLPSS